MGHAHLHAKEALQQLDDIHHVTMHLGSTHLERTSAPTPEQSAILRSLNAEPARTTRTHIVTTPSTNYVTDASHPAACRGWDWFRSSNVHWSRGSTTGVARAEVDGPTQP